MDNQLLPIPISIISGRALITVLAVLHANLTKLPEERSELYDECVQLMLGRRKNAEVQLLHDDRVQPRVVSSLPHMDWEYSRRLLAHVAYESLAAGKEFLPYSDILGYLVDAGAIYGPSALQAQDAKAFLQHQELRTGLLVRNHRHNVRFVHYTFHEYLTAWRLVHLSPGGSLELRGLVRHVAFDARWQEVLVLVGAELARLSSGRFADYLSMLLELSAEELSSMADRNLRMSHRRWDRSVRGKFIRQTQLVALCAVIIEDTQHICKLPDDVEQTYQSALQEVLEVLLQKAPRSAPGSRPKVRGRRTRVRRAQVNAANQGNLLDILLSFWPRPASVVRLLLTSPRDEVRARAISFLVDAGQHDAIEQHNFFTCHHTGTLGAYIDALFTKNAEYAVAMFSKQEDFSLFMTKLLGQRMDDLVRQGHTTELAAIVKHLTLASTWRLKDWWRDYRHLAAAIHSAKWLLEPLVASGWEGTAELLISILLVRAQYTARPPLSEWKMTLGIVSTIIELLAVNYGTEPRVWDAIRTVAREAKLTSVRCMAGSLLAHRFGADPEVARMRKRRVFVVKNDPSPNLSGVARMLVSRADTWDAAPSMSRRLALLDNLLNSIDEKKLEPQTRDWVIGLALNQADPRIRHRAAAVVVCHALNLRVHAREVAFGDVCRLKLDFTRPIDAQAIAIVPEIGCDVGIVLQGLANELSPELTIVGSFGESFPQMLGDGIAQPEIAADGALRRG